MTIDLGWLWTVIVVIKITRQIFQNGERCDNWVSTSQIRNNHPSDIVWHHDLWPWITLNRFRSRSQNFRMKYLEYRERYNVRYNGCQVANHQWVSNWHHAHWLWMTLNCLRFRSRDFLMKYLEYENRYNVRLWRGQIETN